jgi:hypothetical protein
MPKQQTRAQRRAAARAVGVRKKRLGVFPVAMVLLLAVGAGAIALQFRERSTPAQPPEGVLTFANLDRSHIDGPIDYDVIPPAGGPHAGVWQNCGFYSEPVVTEAAVHSLEHAVVWITFDPGLDERDINFLRGLAGSAVLVSPWADPAELPSPVVASAWGAQIHLDSVDDPRLGEFINFYRHHPGAPEPGGACTGGIGQPE